MENKIYSLKRATEILGIKRKTLEQFLCDSGFCRMKYNTYCVAYQRYCKPRKKTNDKKVQYFVNRIEEGDKVTYITEQGLHYIIGCMKDGKLPEYIIED